MSSDDPNAFPAMTMVEADALLTAPAGLFPIETTMIAGRAVRTWSGLPPTLGALLEQARLRGDDPFLILDDDRVSYDAFHRATMTLAAALAELGVVRGDRVAIAMRNLPEWPVALFATVVLGAIGVPLNAWWTGPELAFALEDSGANVLICDAERRDRLRDCPELAPSLKHLVVTRALVNFAPDLTLEALIGSPGTWADLPERSIPDPGIGPDDDATLLYTSGTSGRPKGAVGTHRNLLTCIGSMRYLAARASVRSGLTPAPPAPKVLLLVIPLFHVTGLAANLLPHMAVGSKIVLMGRWSPIEGMRLIERERVTVTGGVPTIATQLLDDPQRSNFDLSSLEVVTYGGASSAPDLANRIATDFACAPGNGWGMTETSATVTGHFGPDYVLRPESAGPPVPVAEIRVVAEGRDLAAGLVGEMWVRGPQVVRGYWNRPASTAESFVDGWLRTGDLCRVDDEGFVYVVDRLKDMVIRGGENIYSVEVEAALHEHPAVMDVAVVGIAHASLGEEPAAVVQLAPGQALTEDELRRWLKGRLASFKIPVRIIFDVEPLPRNANGKVLKSSLKTWFKVPG